MSFVDMPWEVMVALRTAAAADWDRGQRASGDNPLWKAADIARAHEQVHQAWYW